MRDITKVTYMTNYNNTLELKKEIINIVVDNELDNFGVKELCVKLNIQHNKSVEQQITNILKQIGYKGYIKKLEGRIRRIWSKDITIPEVISTQPNDIYIYFILDRDNSVIKIGISNNPKYRLNQLVTGNPFDLVIIGQIKGSSKEEKYLHNYFKEFNKKNEWFYYNKAFKDKLLTYLLNRDLLFNYSNL